MIQVPWSESMGIGGPEQKEPERKEPERKELERKEPERKESEKKEPKKKEPENIEPENKDPEMEKSASEAPVLYVTDDGQTARSLRGRGEAVLIYLHEGNQDQDFSDFFYAVEDPENLDPEYVDKVYRRLKGLPWDILETERCLIRETTPEDVNEFFNIYSDPVITKYMDGLYPEPEQEKQYIREYIEKVYSFYEFGIWTVVERKSGAIIGRAGFAYREGYNDPELGFIIGVPWQRKGYAEEVCRAVLEYGWNALGFEQVQVLVEPGNEVSLRLCAKLGFQEKEKLKLQGKVYKRLLLTYSHLICKWLDDEHKR